MDCPTCNATLSISERKGVEIDYCPKCRGIWLDRGELDKLIDLSVQERTSKPARPKRERYDDDDDYYRGRKKKKESWLRELFDFD